MNVLQHTRNERNPCLKQNPPDRSYRDTLLILKSIKDAIKFDVTLRKKDMTEVFADWIK